MTPWRLVITILLVYSGTAMAWKAPLRGADEGTAIPGSYIIRLDRRCSLKQHLENINTTQQDKYFKTITDMVSFARVYSGTFPPDVVEKIRSDSCVRCTYQNQRLEPEPALEHETEEDQFASTHTPKIKRNSALSLMRRDRENPWVATREYGAAWNLRVLAMETRENLTHNKEGNEHHALGFAYPRFSHSGAGVVIYVLESESFDPRIQREFIGRVVNWTTAGGLPRADRMLRANCMLRLLGHPRLGVAPWAEFRFATLGSSGLDRMVYLFQKIYRDHRRRLATMPAGFSGSIVATRLRYTLSNDMHELLTVPLRLLHLSGVLVVASSNSAIQGVRDVSTWAAGFNRVVLPCQGPGVICVGGMNQQYEKPPIINYGEAVNIWAPGRDVHCTPTPPGHRIILTSFEGPAPALVAGVAGAMLGYLAVTDRSVLYNSMKLRKHLIGNAKRDFLITDSTAGGIGISSRNLLANTGIASSQNEEGMFPAPFREIDSPYKLLLDAGATDTSHFIPARLTMRIDPPRCERSTTNRVTWDQAENLYLSLQWERGHVNEAFYREETPLVPCYEGACVTVFSHRAGGNAIWNMRRYEEHLLHIIVYCLDRDPSQPKETRMTGGSLVLWDGIHQNTLALRKRPDYIDLPETITDADIELGSPDTDNEWDTDFEDEPNVENEPPDDASTSSSISTGPIHPVHMDGPVPDVDAIPELSESDDGD